MRSLHGISASKSLRIIFAAGFLAVMLIEWGSHNLAFAHHAPNDAMITVSSDGQHEDPCKTMVHSGEQNRRSPSPKVAHDLFAQQNVFLGGSMFSDRNVFTPPEPDIERLDAQRINRPPDPPFLPPELS